MDSPVDILKQLIAIPSVNPEDTSDGDITGEGRLADFLAERLEGRGLRVSREDVRPGRPNVIAESCPADGRPTIMIEAHLDTVSVKGMVVDPFDPVERDGRMYGRGACDDKGPMAASLSALTADRVRALHRAGLRLVYVGAMGEEKGNHGARRLVEQGALRADQIVVLEPTDLEIVHAHKGVIWLDLELLGRAVHGSEPDRGVSAIEGAMEFVRSIRKDLAAAVERGVTSALLGPPTVNIGRIEGGSQVNIVPASCRLQVDRRMVPGEKADKVLADFRTELDRLQARGRLTGFHLHAFQQGDPFETQPDCGLVRRFRDCLEACGVAPRLAGAAWYSDAGPLSALCRDVLVFGPGSIRQAHTADEFIEIQSLMTGAKVLGEWLERLCREGVGGSGARPTFV